MTTEGRTPIPPSVLSKGRGRHGYRWASVLALAVGVSWLAVIGAYVVIVQIAEWLE